jgi:hypothetical protein
MKFTAWTERRSNGTVINPGTGDGLVTIKPGQVAVVLVFDPGDPKVGRLLRLADLMLAGDGDVVP